MKTPALLMIEKTVECIKMPPMDSEKAMAVINKMALEKLAPEDVYIGRERLANDQYDRAGERFPIAYLERFAQTLPGKSVLEGHDKSKAPVGLYIGASVARDDSGKTHLIADYYLPAKSELTQRVKMGIARYKSIGFVAAGRTCDLCGEPYEQCDHVALHTYDGKQATVTYSGDVSKVEAMEGSFVWMGAQIGAQTVGGKLVADGGGYVVKVWETGMETKELEERVKALESENTALKESAAKAAALEARAKDGEQYVTDLKAEIIRKMGVLEEDPEPQKDLLNDASLTALKAWDGRLGKRLEEKFPPIGVSRMLGQGADPAPGQGGIPPPAEFDPHRSLKRQY
jgi:hypothetical protein